jgi:hypothetical protein
MNAKNNLDRCGEQAAVEYLERAGLHTVSSVSDRRLPSIAPSSKNSPEGLPLLGVASLTHGVINDDYSMTDLPKDGVGSDHGWVGQRSLWGPAARSASGAS